MNDIQLDNYFGCPFWILQKDEHVNDILKITDKYIDEARNKNKKIFKNKSEFGISHQSGSLQLDKDLSLFIKEIGQLSWNFLDSQGFDLQYHNLIFTEMWVQEFAKKGGHHDTHIHHNNHVSGFYFLKCSNKTSYPIFHDPKQSAVMTKLPLKDPTKPNFGSQSINYLPKPGTMIIFNSYMPHQFPLDFGIEPFRFIHWNIQAIPKGIMKEQI
jgi:uncharacterized protein (TIGR02466 family)